MGTQDFITPNPIDQPRHEQNMPIDVETPVPSHWHLTRPGDSLENLSLDDDLTLIGNIGPGGGFALTLVKKMHNQIHLLPHEHIHDVESLLGEIAMRRASFFTRAPIKSDVEFALKIFSYDKIATKGEEKWRVALVHDCGHNEHRRRQIVNSIPVQVIGGTFQDLEEHVDSWWKQLQKFI
ncbi:MAG: hypothetical protein KBF89_07305 [Acidimicrobiia bacterium]|nr:hypothetical protein [Acidimicrobiia bacterium]